MQVDGSGQIIVGPTLAFGSDSGVRAAAEQVVDAYRGLLVTPLMLLSVNEAFVIAEHLEAGHIVLDAARVPVAAPGCPNYPAAAVLAAYLDLALEYLARQLQLPRLDTLLDILLLLRRWPLDHGLVEGDQCEQQSEQ